MKSKAKKKNIDDVNKELAVLRESMKKENAMLRKIISSLKTLEKRKIERRKPKKS